jgi:DNA-binding LacI/PurR family transcriptional regulator
MKTPIPDTPALPKRLSLVSQTVQSLCEGIRSGHWQGQLPGERVLCERLQVSRRTLRAALDELQRQGWLTVSRRRRRCIQSKRRAAPERTPKKIIGVLSASTLQTLQPPMMLVMDALRDKLSEAGYELQLHASRSCFSSKPAHALEKLIGQNPASAWLILGSKEPMQRWFIRQHVPCLVLGSCAPAIALPSVDVDYHAACHHAGALLWRKGHRHIALVLPQDAYGGDLASEAGLRESLQGFPGTHLRVLRHNGTAANLCTLIDKALQVPDPPTAYLVAHAMPVLTTLTHLLRRGRRIPQDIALISRDDDPFVQSTSPSLACYVINRILIARRASMAVRQLVETGTLPANAIRLIPKFVAAESV